MLTILINAAITGYPYVSATADFHSVRVKTTIMYMYGTLWRGENYNYCKCYLGQYGSIAVHVHNTMSCTCAIKLKR